MMNISVIIPVYNVEKFVERCVRSIMNQTYTEGVECIIVNDCTPDDSMKIVEKLVKDYTGTICFKLLNHKQNYGLAAVRNTGMNAATGEYIIHIDSDDYCEPDMLEKMYSKAIEENADIVVADCYINYPEKEVYSADYVPKSKKKYVEALLTNAMVAVWNKLVRHNLYSDNDIKFIPGIDMGEDELVSHKLFYYADKVVYLPLAFVHYVCYNPNSYSSSVSRKSLSDILLVEKNLLDFYAKVGMSRILYKELLLLKMRNWQRLLCYSGGSLQKKYNQHYSEISFWTVVKYYPSNITKIFLLLASLNMLSVANGLLSIYRQINYPHRKYITYNE